MYLGPACLFSGKDKDGSLVSCDLLTHAPNNARILLVYSPDAGAAHDFFAGAASYEGPVAGPSDVHEAVTSPGRWGCAVDRGFFASDNLNAIFSAREPSIYWYFKSNTQ